MPDYPVGHQLRWLLGAVVKPPVPTALLKAHFDAEFLSAVPPASFNSVLTGLQLKAPVRITSLDAGTTPTALVADIAFGETRIGLAISVDASGLINGLRVSPEPPPPPAAPTSWAALDAQVRSLAPDVSFEAATISPPNDGPSACRPVNAIAPATARALGSLFKLYVLATLEWGRHRAALVGRLCEPHVVAAQPSERADPDRSDRDPLYGQRTGELMISSSDNTAADELAALVGRPAIEAQVGQDIEPCEPRHPFLTHAGTVRPQVRPLPELCRCVPLQARPMGASPT